MLMGKTQKEPSEIKLLSTSVPVDPAKWVVPLALYPHNALPIREGGAVPWK